jgi:hypothetical protein
MNDHNFILLYTFSPSPVIKQTMVINPFADICKKQGPTCKYTNTDPKVPAPHLESLYVSSLREFLSSINGSIVTEHSYTIPLQQVHDRAIMDVVIASNLFTPSECKTINYCRMFLRVHSIADLTLACGNCIDFSFLPLDQLLLSSASTLIEPLQD